MTLRRLVRRALGLGSNLPGSTLPSTPPVESEPGDLHQGRFGWRMVTLNLPLLLGVAILLFLLVVALFGPRLATENPYISGLRLTEVVDGRFETPPFEPSPQYPLGSDPWGRDLASVLLYGARNTLVAGLFVTMVRVAIGLLLGGLAGWREGGLADRVIMSVIEILSSLPLLITGVILIYALDIRRGLTVFMAALSLVGWGEIAQHIRAEFVALREGDFVEAAWATGLRGPQIVVRHLLPNVLPQLIVLTLFEMGAVLMLLGELGFVGVFIGGGSETELLSGVAVIADVPEWGAALAGARGHLRSAPWTVLYPALAFFVSVLGLNLMGEGLRRLIREAGVNTAVLLSKRMVLVALMVAVATAYVVERISPNTSYAELAEQFDAAHAVAHAERIYAFQADDPGFGTEGARQAAEYIAEQLEALGALPAATNTEYLQPVVRRVATRIEAPLVAAIDDEGEVRVKLTHGIDYGEQVARHGGSGDVEALLTYVRALQSDLAPDRWRGLDLSGRIAVVRAGEIPPDFDIEALIRGALACLVIADDVVPHVDWGADGGAFMETPQLPVVRLTPEAFDRLVAAEGTRIAALAAVGPPQDDDAQHVPDWLAIPLRTRVRVRLALSEAVERTGYNVLAIVPGNDTAVDKEALVVTSHYDLPEPCPGQAYGTVAEGPAGVGVVLEVLRLWQTSEFRPRRTMLIHCWAGGYLGDSGALTYVREYSPYRSLSRQAIVHLGTMGASGVGDEASTANGLAIAGGGPMRDLLARSARAGNTTMVEGAGYAGGGAPEYAREFGGSSVTIGWASAPLVYADDWAGTPLSSEALRRAGEAVNLALITASRQYHY